MKVFLVLFLISFNLFAVSPPVSKYLNTTQQKIAIENKSQDSLEDEFDDEFDEDEVEVNDPFSGYNRSMTYFNDVVYTNVLIPVSTGYSEVVHVEIRQGISNMFSNLVFPVRFVNNVLQLKFDNALEETGRFLINSTIGLLGFFDPAKEELEWQAHNEDFGQTLGFYGVGPGPHVVLPFLGPSNIRDAFSIIPDSMLNPTSEYFYDLPFDSSNGIVLNGVFYINKASLHLGEYESLKKDAIDFYPFMRDLYEQNRINEIKE